MRFDIYSLTKSASVGGNREKGGQFDMGDDSIKGVEKAQNMQPSARHSNEILTR